MGYMPGCLKRSSIEKKFSPTFWKEGNQPVLHSMNIYDPLIEIYGMSLHYKA